MVESQFHKLFIDQTHLKNTSLSYSVKKYNIILRCFEAHTSIFSLDLVMAWAFRVPISYDSYLYLYFIYIMWVCVYMYMYIFQFPIMGVYMFVCVCVCVYIYIYLPVCHHGCIYACVCVYVYICQFAIMDVYMFVCMYNLFLASS